MSTNTIENETIEDQTDQVADTVVEGEPQLGEGPEMTIGPDADDMAEMDGLADFSGIIQDAEDQVTKHKGTVEEFPETPLSDAESQLIEIQNAELEIRQAEAEVEICKSDLKIARERLKGMVDRMRTAASASANDANRPLLPENQPESSAEEPDADPDCWRTTTIDILWASDKPEFKGLGNKKMEALIDEVKTLGGFEDLRVQVGDKFEHLSKALPQGIGESLADELENRHLEYVAQWSPEPAEDPEKSDFEVELLTRVDELSENKTDWTEGEGEIHEKGTEAYDEDKNLDDCPYRKAGWEQNQWLMGFYDAMAKHRIETEFKPANDPEYEDADLSDL